MTVAPFLVPLIIRGEVLSGELMTHEGRRGGLSFCTPDCTQYLARLVLENASEMSDLYSIRVDDILDYLDALGERLHLDRNPHLVRALEISKSTSGLPDTVLEAAYRDMHRMFERATVREIAESCVGIEFLDGWVTSARQDGRTISVRAFGARSVHIIAGNLPSTAAATIVRNAITRGDAIIKTPSNDPMTAAAIALTMIEMAPDHPLTKHVTVAYWRGGNESVESGLYQPRNIEKIVAWGGFSSIRHVTRYLQPGIDLITLDPKLSASIVGKQVFESPQSMADVAIRLATDIAAYNQEACVNARVIYVECESDDAGLARLNELGAMVSGCFAALPAAITNTPKASAVSRDLADEIRALRINADSYRVFGADIADGLVLVSQFDDPVDFASKLANRVANIVPVASIDAAIRFVTAETQTIGVYPESLKHDIRDRLAFQGGQRIVSLGYAAHFNIASPQDGLEPVRRMCKWIFDDQCNTDAVAPLWL